MVSGSACRRETSGGERKPLTQTRTISAPSNDVGEAFGIASDDGENIFFTDGANGKIFRLSRKTGAKTLVSGDFDTPSGIAFDRSENALYVTDAGQNVIKKINLADGAAQIFAGTENRRGMRDGAARDALFDAPLGIAAGQNGKIFVADTYNNKIRLIENGEVKNFAGDYSFKMPVGIAFSAAENAVWIADTGNAQVVKLDAESGAVKLVISQKHKEFSTAVGLPHNVRLLEPTGVAADRSGAVFIADAGAGKIFAYGRKMLPLLEEITGGRRGFLDGKLGEARFVRPTDLFAAADGSVFVADAAAAAVRVLADENSAEGVLTTEKEAAQNRLSAEQMREMGEPRWTYNPPDKVRDIAGTFGEIRGEIVEPNDYARFHNGLDIAGNYGETAYFIRDEKVLLPDAVENVSTLRELLRLPTIGYIHVNLGRDVNGKVFDDKRFTVEFDGTKAKDVVVRRGAKFKAGEQLGTLNAMNHVHLIAGRQGAEMNALAGLRLPNVKDTIAPIIEDVAFYDENWSKIDSPQNLRGKIRVVATAFDRVDGNPERRKLGVYALGFQLFKNSGEAFEGERETINFEKLPENDAANQVYAIGSKSGATGPTFFRYIVTNEVRDGQTHENFLDTTQIPNGVYRLKLFAADFFGNRGTKEIQISVSN